MAVTKAILPLTDFYYHDGVRMEAIRMLPLLLKCVHRSWAEKNKQNELQGLSPVLGVFDEIF